MKVDIEDIKEFIQKYTYEHKTDEAIDIIKNRSGGSTYAYDIWKDGELTGTKGGDLYGKRLLHIMEEPIGVKLFDIPDSGKQESRIIDPDHVDDLRILIRAYRDQNKIMAYIENGEWKYIKE